MREIESNTKNVPNGTRSQFDAYKKRKHTLFERMKIGASAMCILIIILIWLQDAIPKYYKKFWTKGLEYSSLLNNTQDNE